MKFPIYFDHQATTMVDPMVLKTMLPYFCENFGNPSSRSHSVGREAEKGVELARSQVAQLIGAEPHQIYFTSGATESNNLALVGAFEQNKKRGNHLIVSSVEHKSILDTCRSLEKRGAEITYLPVDRFGKVSPNDIQNALRPSTILVSILFANNEIGSINPLEDIGKICQQAGVAFHTDAVQAAGTIAINVNKFCLDSLSLSSHKIYGPKGVGALFLRDLSFLEPQLHGGGQERGLRPGTLNVPAIVGFGKATEITLAVRETEGLRLRKMRDTLWETFQRELPEIYLNGHPSERIPNNLNVSFAGTVGAALMNHMPEIAISSGSSCNSASIEPSYVLLNTGLSRDLAHGSLRFGLGRFTTQQEVDYLLERVITTVRKVRKFAIPVHIFS